MINVAKTIYLTGFMASMLFPCAVQARDALDEITIRVIDGKDDIPEVHNLALPRFEGGQSLRRNHSFVPEQKIPHHDTDEEPDVLSDSHQDETELDDNTGFESGNSADSLDDSDRSDDNTLPDLPDEAEQPDEPEQIDNSEQVDVPDLPDQPEEHDAPDQPDDGDIPDEDDKPSKED